MAKKTFKIVEINKILNKDIVFTGTLEELRFQFQDLLLKGYDAWISLRSGGRHKINIKPTTITSLVHNLNLAMINLRSGKDLRVEVDKKYDIIK